MCVFILYMSEMKNAEFYRQAEKKSHYIASVAADDGLATPVAPFTNMD